MLKKIRVLSLVCISAAMVACGGGSTDTAVATTPPAGTATPSFAGNYSISALQLTSNTCSFPVTLSFTNLAVTQSDRAVTGTGSGAGNTTTGTGTIDADNGGFTITASMTGQTAILRVRTVTADKTYTVTDTLNFSAAGATCTAVFSGSATKI